MAEFPRRAAAEPKRKGCHAATEGSEVTELLRTSGYDNGWITVPHNSDHNDTLLPCHGEDISSDNTNVVEGSFPHEASSVVGPPYTGGRSNDGSTQQVTTSATMEGHCAVVEVAATVALPHSKTTAATTDCSTTCMRPR